MIVNLKRRHRAARTYKGLDGKEAILAGEFTGFTTEGRIEYCCQAFEKAEDRYLIEFSYRNGCFEIEKRDDDDTADHVTSGPLTFCPFCGQKIDYKIVKNIEVVQVTETKTRTIPNFVQQGFREETYQETHDEEREVPPPQ